MSSVPLSPAVGGQCISESALALADLIVSTTSAMASRAIRVGTGSPVSHSMVYVGGGEVIEAIGKGVVRRSLAAALADATLAVAYRHKDMEPKVAERVVSFARAQVGRAYDYSGVAGAGARANAVVCVVALGIVGCAAARKGALDRRDRFYCSELVLEAYRRAGVPITNGNPNVSNPHHIVEAHSQGKLLYVGHLKA